MKKIEVSACGEKAETIVYEFDIDYELSLSEMLEMLEINDQDARD